MMSEYSNHHSGRKVSTLLVPKTDSCLDYDRPVLTYGNLRVVEVSGVRVGTT